MHKQCTLENGGYATPLPFNNAMKIERESGKEMTAAKREAAGTKEDNRWRSSLPGIVRNRSSEQRS
jgi:hypothetical protein